MARRPIQAGVADQTIDIFVPDSSSTVGAGLTGLVFNTAGLTCYYRKGATGASTALTLATQTVGGAHSDGGFVALDATNMPGAYRLDLSDTMVAATTFLTIYLRGATNMAPVVIEVPVVGPDFYDTVRMGLTALPNAAADAAGGLAISDAGGLDLDARLDAAVSSRMATYTQPTGFLAATFPAGTVANTTNITAGTITTVTTTTTATNLTNAPTAGDLTAAMKTSVENAVLNADMTGHQTQGSLGQAIGDPVADTNTIYKAVVTDATGATVGVDVVAVKAETVSLQSGTDNIQTRLPAALVGGKMDASVGALGTDAVSAAALATDAVDEIVAAVFARAFSAGYSSLTFDQLMKIIATAVAGKASGLATTSVKYRNLADSADVIAATVDAYGNRSAVTLTP